MRDPRCGSVTFEQRFGSDLRLNIHFHVLALDGVYSDSSGEPVFHRLAAPTDEEQSQLAVKVHRKVQRILEGQGWVDEEGRRAGPDEEALLELEFAAASAAGRIAQGARRGLRVPPVDRLSWVGAMPSQRSRTFLHGRDRSGLERSFWPEFSISMD